MKKKELQAQFLGGCSLVWAGKELAVSADTSSKPLRLLQMLLYYRSTGLTRAYAIENLFANDEGTNPINNLRNTRFRLKRLLEASGMPAGEYVVIRSGKLYWNPDIPVALDTERFEKTAQRALHEKDPKKSLQSGEEACRMFTGALLPGEAALPWVLQEDLRLKRLYFALLRKTAAALEAAGEYARASELYNNATRLAPYEEEWVAGCIRCLQRSGEHQAALQLYEDTVALFLGEFGVNPSEEFQQSLDNVGSDVGFSSALEIRTCIAEGAHGGAHFCHFAEFVHCCSLVSRLDARSGRATSLIWCTVQPPQNEAEDATLRKQRMAACMMDTLRQSLRGSDIFTRYGERQYLVLLPGSGNTSSALVFDRINAQFKANKASYGYTLSLRIVPLVPLYAEGGAATPAPQP